MPTMGWLVDWNMLVFHSWDCCVCVWFSRMRSEGFWLYIWGSGGWPVFARPCFWRPQPSATVRNRLQPSVCDRRGRKVSVPIGKVAKTCLFRRVRSCGHGVLRCRRGTSWHSNMFHDLSKSRFCVAGAILLLHFQKGVLHFSWHAQHFGPFRCHFPWHAQRFGRVAFRVFCESHCQRCAKWWQGVIPWQAWHFVTCHENRRKPRTKRRVGSRSI